MVRERTLHDHITRILKEKVRGESLLLRGDTVVAELPAPQKMGEVLDIGERVLDTWGMRSNFKRLERFDPC